MRKVSPILLSSSVKADDIGLGYPADSILVHGSYLINLGHVYCLGGLVRN